jgi:hypothetical protein
MAALPQVEFIVQRNEETRPVWEGLEAVMPANASFLFDESKGTGLMAAAWPQPPANGSRFGYAGGLGPTTLAEQLGKMADTIEHSDREDAEIWVDMESSLRTKLADGADIFDVNKAMSCIIIVVESAGKVCVVG